MTAQAGTMPTGVQVRFNRFLALVYLVMAIGLGVTGWVSVPVSSNPEMVRRILFNPWFAWGLFFLQLIVVAFLSAAVMRLSPAAAFLLFLVYAGLMGVSLSAIFLYYSQATISSTFVVAAGMFLLSSLVGLLIRRDLSGGSQFILMALLGWTFAYILSWFFPVTSLLSQTTTAVGILLFARPHRLGHAAAEATVRPDGGTPQHGRYGRHRRAGALPRLHQPVLAAAAPIGSLAGDGGAARHP